MLLWGIGTSNTPSAQCASPEHPPPRPTGALQVGIELLMHEGRQGPAVPLQGREECRLVLLNQFIEKRGLGAVACVTGRGHRQIGAEFVEVKIDGRIPANARVTRLKPLLLPLDC